MACCLSPTVHFRALLPRRDVDVVGWDATMAEFRLWFANETEAFEILDATVGEIGSPPLPAVARPHDAARPGRRARPASSSSTVRDRWGAARVAAACSAPASNPADAGRARSDVVRAIGVDAGHDVRHDVVLGVAAVPWATPFRRLRGLAREIGHEWSRKAHRSASPRREDVQVHRRDVVSEQAMFEPLRFAAAERVTDRFEQRHVRPLVGGIRHDGTNVDDPPWPADLAPRWTRMVHFEGDLMRQRRHERSVLGLEGPRPLRSSRPPSKPSPCGHLA